MKRSFLKKVIAIVIATISILTINMSKANAAWDKNVKNNWNWIEDGIKSVGWKMIDEKWYHFDKDGIMNTGWININKNWYHLSESGAMNIGWLRDNNGKWYNLSEDGVMNIGWISENNHWYYMNSSGAMETEEVELNGNLYTFSENGILLNSKSISSENTSNPQESIVDEKNDVKESNEKLTEVRKAYVATESSPLNIRSEASTSSEIIGTLPKGTEITVNSTSVDGFLRISSNGVNGWASSMWISFDKPNNISEKPTISADDKEINEDGDIKIDDSLKSIRTVAPEENNPCYYSDSNIFYKIKLAPPYSSGGNCTWYSWGRACEITGEVPTKAGFTGNAYEWWQANKNSGKYRYGSTPKVGAIAVWKSSLPGSSGCGHVAVVEKIENGKVYISESMWHGGIFKYTEIYSTNYLYGYIYLNEPNY